MWETILHIEYVDFELGKNDFSIYKAQVDQFVQVIQDSCDSLCPARSSCCVPGTEEQSESEKWFLERWPRITASKCKLVTVLGEDVASEHPSKLKLYNFLYHHFWFQKKVLTSDMKYGIEMEPIARHAYCNKTGASVISTGFWVNKEYSHLGACQDGIIIEDGKEVGIIEIKCLKIFRSRNVEDLLSDISKGTIPKKLIQRQCFLIHDDGSLKLKQEHKYYYQVQLQLLVNDLSFCDFVLYSGKGTIHIEKIFPDKTLQYHIISATYAYWYFCSRILFNECTKKTTSTCV